MSYPFVRKASEYTRDIDVEKGAITQIAKYSSLQLNISYDDALKHVLELVREGKDFGIKDPMMSRLDRKAIGHRVLVEDSSFLQYIHDIRSSGRIVSPSMVIYERPEVEKSVTAEWQDVNIKARKTAKMRMHTLGQAGDKIGAQLADYDQNARKIRINSVSGMRGFKGCALFMETGHSSLTSMCRAAAGYGNGTVERLLAGCRHYHTPEIVRANIAAVLTIESEDIFTPVLEKYKLVYPTVDDVMSMIVRSSEMYWLNGESGKTELESIYNAVRGMTDLERAIYLYTGDMYHMAILNEDALKEFFRRITANDIDYEEDIDPKAILGPLAGTDRAYINSLCAEIMSGKSNKDLEEPEERENYLTVARTAKSVVTACHDYGDLIQAFLVPKHLPPTVAHMKDIMRRRSLIADTDSSIFTTEWWVKWYNGHTKRGDMTDKVWYASTYIVCQCIAHSLAILSANVGVSEDMLYRLAMKNEYGFPVLGVTPISKHYFSFMSIQEGNVFKEYKKEIKGVGLRGSTAPKVILDVQEQLMTDIMTIVDNDGQMSMYDLIKRVADYEMQVMRSIVKGDYKYLRSGQIKPDTGNVVYYEMWQDVFGPKYGIAEALPIPTVVVSTDLDNKTKLNEWLENLEDREFAARMKAWCVKYNRDKLSTLLLPYQALKQHGLPIEVQEAANLRKLIYKTMTGFYLILETCGLYLVDREYRRLCYDYLDLDPMTATIDHELPKD